MSTPSPSGGPQRWTPKSLLDWSTGYFSGKGIPTPKLDSEILLAHVLGCSRIDLYLQFDRPLNSDELGAYRELVRGRAERTPVAYLIGEVGFWNLTLSVGAGCLIPRAETEALVEAALQAVNEIRGAGGDEHAPVHCLELGTGSGAIPLAIFSERERICWVASDISGWALAYARKNIGAHARLLEPRGNVIHLVQGDGFAAISPGAQAQLIVSNPPYIPRDVLPELEPEVARSEPACALDGGPDGLDYYRELAAVAADRLCPGGRLLLEIGADQGDSLREILEGHEALDLLRVGKDLAGRERVVQAVRR